MTGEQGTFWDGISTTPFRRLRRGALTRDEAKRRQKERAAKWYAEHGAEYIRQYRAKKIEADPAFLDKERARSRKHRRKVMGINNPTSETRTGPCAICKRVLRLQLDHDHETGEWRGWLCVGCNTKVEWCIKNLDALEKYLAV